MSQLEYEAGKKLGIAAIAIRNETGANPFFSLIHAAFRHADSPNHIVLARMFPETHEELLRLRQSPIHSNAEDDILAAAKLMVRVRSILGIGLQLYEISTEIANATGDKIDEIQYLLSQHYDELVDAYA